MNASTVATAAAHRLNPAILPARKPANLLPHPPAQPHTFPPAPPAPRPACPPPHVQVLQGVREVEVSDYEVMHSYRQLRPGRVQGRQRSCLYLQPQEAKYFQAGGAAVAVYDYSVVMRRLNPEADAPAAAVACVETPKQFFQCL